MHLARTCSAPLICILVICILGRKEKRGEEPAPRVFRAGEFKVKTRRALLTIAAATLAATLGAVAPGAEESTAVLSPQALQEIAQVEAEIDRIEAADDRAACGTAG